MLRPFRKLVKFASSPKGAKITLVSWLLAVLLFSLFAPGAKEFAVNSKEASVGGDRPSEIADHVLKGQFSNNDGMPALLVFHRDGKITSEDREKITKLSEWLASDEKPKHIISALPFHQFPEKVQDEMFSDDGSTLLFNLSLESDLDSDITLKTLDLVREKVDAIGIEGMQFEITGPAGISADTISLFKNADIVLMLATVGLIFVILILIYRSPLLAITPLLIAGIVYGVVDRILGLAGKYNWFTVDSSAISIMLVLLFAVLTDYSLFVFSRYREELKKQESKYSAMGEAIYHVSEPIVFSGGTVFLAMLTLFVTVFQPYNHFAPVFSVAVIVILLAGLTLIPSIFALMGRKAFWPFVPKVESANKVKAGIWNKISQLVMKRPAVLAGILLIVLLVGAFNFSSIKYSFNLLKSFPEDMPSRQGFELLEKNYPAGQLAPVNIVLQSNTEFEVNDAFFKNVNSLVEKLEDQKGISSVTPVITDQSNLPRNFLSKSEKAIRIQLILEDNPYDTAALDTVQKLRDSADTFIKDSGFSTKNVKMHIAGQTAQQVDVRQMNNRDMIVLFSLVVILLTFVLGFQTQSVLMPILMMSTILLSYFSTLGFGWWIFHHLMGFEAISYRLPVYTFVFMVALGIDYNIMLVSRIREEAQSLSWKDAVGKGVALTGGVISSAGLILAATFAVLMTQPLQELFLFGFTMAMGILLDTFLIRGIFLPSILILTHKDKKQMNFKEIKMDVES
ncbi:MMPL family transporter [Lederbergia wuyishanensis]|uniref:RND superfamily putative drug exporter n=1 Tax=Lederbergia wuyishanensis TaxID=1347903 RepID=A0ABU0D5H5_9BACI|nr:MMPL family transporter [Lederbergia wuyishanensis]MCJ8009812.1 MMPL family transporter [Lederbergia wuyishanensis]MDQ0343668.1 RND superfamily putative drug exporter [Lederbergia wuyishanensis]